MKINGSPAYVKVVKGFIDRQKKAFEGKLKPNHTLFKEPSPEIQQMRELLKNRKKAIENLAAEQTAKKIARGEVITEAEREKLRRANPEKLRKAEEANEKRVALSKRLARAKTKMEVATIIAGERSMALTIYDKGDQELGELYLEAVGQAEDDYYQGKKSNPGLLKNPHGNKQAHLFDLRL